MFVFATASRLLITRPYFRLKRTMNRIEKWANKIDNTHRFHAKYGKGTGCVITDCECKA